MVAHSKELSKFFRNKKHALNVLTKDGHNNTFPEAGRTILALMCKAAICADFEFRVRSSSAQPIIKKMSILAKPGKDKKGPDPVAERSYLFVSNLIKQNKDDDTSTSDDDGSRHAARDLSTISVNYGLDWMAFAVLSYSTKGSTDAEKFTPLLDADKLSKKPDDGRFYDVRDYPDDFRVSDVRIAAYVNSLRGILSDVVNYLHMHDNQGDSEDEEVTDSSLENTNAAENKESEDQKQSAVEQETAQEDKEAAQNKEAKEDEKSEIELLAERMLVFPEFELQTAPDRKNFSGVFHSMFLKENVKEEVTAGVADGGKNQDDSSIKSRAEKSDQVSSDEDDDDLVTDPDFKKGGAKKTASTPSSKRKDPPNTPKRGRGGNTKKKSRRNSGR